MISFLSRHLLTKRHRAPARRSYYRIRKFLADAFYPYTGEQLKQALEQIGVRTGDTLFLHSSFKAQSGFQGTPQEIIASLLDVLGDRGHLLMPSMSYTTSSYEHLMKQEVFDAARTPSRMGLLSELFRRKAGVQRSLNPAHPVLALGRHAGELVSGHEDRSYSCGEGTPFDRFDRMNGKVLFFDVPFNTFTFIHFLEDRLRDRLSFALYRPEPLRASVLDGSGRKRIVPTYVFSEQAVRSRRPEVLQHALEKRGKLRHGRIGRTSLMLVTAQDARECMDDLARQGIFIYGAADHGK